MNLYNNLPIYTLYVDEDQSLEVDKVSIVNSPAVQKNFLAFKDQKVNFSADEERKELLGVALIPDKPIYRCVDNEEFYVTFPKETIRKIALNLFKKGYNTSMNIEHTDKNADSHIYQSFIVDSKLGINSPKGMEELPDGSWVIGVKVNSEELWNDIKSGKRNGFSVEGLFGLEEATDSISEKDLEDYLSAASRLHNLLSNVK